MILILGITTKPELYDSYLFYLENFDNQCLHLAQSPLTTYTNT